jgi:cellulose biosynthesis protein BcsQ
MKIPTITFFNSVGGVGKTTLVYHTAWMLADMGMRVVAADLDPQSSLTVAFLDEDELRDLWQEREKRRTVFGCVEPILHAVGDTGRPDLVRVNDGIALLAGDPLLSVFEDELARSWLECGMGRQAAFRAVSAFWHILQAAAKQHEADCVLIDIGPGLGAITRSALIASENVVFPVSPDLFSLQGLRNIGPTCRKWRGEWRERLAKSGALDSICRQKQCGRLDTSC